MKTGLWVIIAVVAGNVGFLVGYSVSSYTGFKQVGEHARPERSAAGGAAAPSYGAAPAPSYGAAPAPAPRAPAAGYGAEAPDPPGRGK